MPLIEGEPINLYAPLPTNLPAEWSAPSERQLAVLEVPGRGPGYTREQLLVIEEIASERWFILRNVWGWRTGHTGRAGGVEAHYTAFGVERPFRGTDAIYALFRDRLRDDESARAFLREALKLGAIEPITSERAKGLCLRILMRSRGRVDLWRRGTRG